MSQVASAPASVTAAVAAPVEPAAKPTLDPSEFSRLQSENAALQRQLTTANGWKPYFDKANKLGISKPEEFDRFTPVIQHLSKNKIDPQDFMRAFGAVQQDDPGASPQLTIQRVEEMLNSKLSESKKEWIREQAEKEHGATLDSELGELSDENIAKLLGEDVPEPLRKLAGRAAVGMWMDSRQAYGEGHPLHTEKGRFGGAGRNGIDGVHKSLKEQTAAIVAALQAKQAAALGDAARKRPTITPAGSQGGGGKATTAAPGSPDSKREKLEKIAAGVLAKKA